MSMTPHNAKRCHNRDSLTFRCSSMRSDWTLEVTSKVSNIFPLTYLFFYVGMLSLPTNLKAHSLGFRWKYVRDFSFGIESFKVELLEKCTKDNLASSERYWLHWYRI